MAVAVYTKMNSTIGFRLRRTAVDFALDCIADFLKFSGFNSKVSLVQHRNAFFPGLQLSNSLAHTKGKFLHLKEGTQAE
jgi:hypothetical protein